MTLTPLLEESEDRARSGLPDLAAVLAAGSLVLITAVGLLWTKIVPPVVLALAVLLLTAASLRERRVPMPDRLLAGLFGALVLWSGLGALWAIEPALALDRSVKLLFLLAPLLPLLSAPVARLLGDSAIEPHYFLIFGLLIGGGLIIVEYLFDFPLHRLTHNTYDIENQYYNWAVHTRGVTYLVVLAWPAAAFLWLRRRPWAALAMIGFAGSAVVVGFSTAAALGVAGSLATFAAARLAPRLTTLALGGGVVVVALLSLFLLPRLFQTLPTSGGGVPYSTHHRLEIYDFTGHRIAERPWLGWGADSARHLPVSAEELSHYQIFDRPPTHSHNPFLQAEVELGVPGPLFLVGLLLVVLIRIGRLHPPLRPFALACFSASFGIGLVSYSLWSGTWLVMLFVAVFGFYLLSARDTARSGRPA